MTHRMRYFSLTLLRALEALGDDDGRIGQLAALPNEWHTPRYSPATAEMAANSNSTELEAEG